MTGFESMEIEIQKWLLDAHKASQAIQEFLKEKDYEDWILVCAFTLVFLATARI